jgi:uncharacterized protein YutE (UPF0331/DUF86 family)
VVDRDRVFRLLAGIEADVAFLARFAERDVDEIVRDDVLLAAIKYGFVTAIEGSAKVAHHLAASEAWPVAETNADAVRTLASEGVLTHELATAIAAAVGFRNLLVHQYGDVDDRLVVQHLAELGDLREFVENVQGWIRRQ